MVAVEAELSLEFLDFESFLKCEATIVDCPQPATWKMELTCECISYICHGHADRARHLFQNKKIVFCTDCGQVGVLLVSLTPIES